MTEKHLKNIDATTILKLDEQVSYMPGQIVSKTLAQNPALNLTLFAFDKGEEISSHESDGDAMVTVLDGTGEITIEDQKYVLHEGETIIMPAHKPHALLAVERFKMLLLVSFN